MCGLSFRSMPSALSLARFVCISVGFIKRALSMKLVFSLYVLNMFSWACFQGLALVFQFRVRVQGSESRILGFKVAVVGASWLRLSNSHTAGKASFSRFHWFLLAFFLSIVLIFP